MRPWLPAELVMLVDHREIALNLELLERAGRSAPESALQLGSGILELVFKHSDIVLKIADLDQATVGDDAHAIVLFPQIVNRKSAVFHVHRLEDGDCFVDELIVVHADHSTFRFVRCQARGRVVWMRCG